MESVSGTHQERGCSDLPMNRLTLALGGGCLVSAKKKGHIRRGREAVEATRMAVPPPFVCHLILSFGRNATEQRGNVRRLTHRRPFGLDLSGVVRYHRLHDF